MNSRFKATTPLRLVLIVPFVLQISIAVGLVGYLSFRNGQAAVDDLAGQLMGKASNLIDQHLDTYLNTPKQINQINADAARLGLLELKNFKNSGHYFWKQMQVFDVSYIGYTLATGEFAGAGHFYDSNSVNIDEVSAASGWIDKTYATDRSGNRRNIVGADNYKPHTEAWFVDAVKAKKPTWSQVYQWDNFPDILSISVGYPLYNDVQSLVAVVYTDLRLSQINDFLRQLKVSRSSKTFILEQNGLLIASSMAEQPFKMANGEAQRLNVLESSDPLTRSTAKRLQERFGSFSNIKSTERLSFDFEGDRHFAEVTPWRDELGLDWLVVVAVPESDFTAQINANTRLTIFLCLGALVGAIGLGIFTSRWITKPIRKLTRASQAIAQGELDQEVNIQGVSELEILAASFNRMADQLRQSFAALSKTNEDLEHRVVDRTAELKAAKEAADTANQSKSEFLANISHELRTPLNGVLGYTQILQRDSTASPQQQAGMAIIHQCGFHLLTLINDILDLSKIEARKLELKPQYFRFDAFLKGIVEICRIKAEQRNIAFIYNRSDRLPAAVCADEQRLRQVLINLLGNAAKFTDWGSVTLTVSAIAPLDSPLESGTLPTTIRFEIEDTGVGIPAEQIDRIFLPFEQVGHNRSVEGTGLGLPISKQIVQTMGSELQVESRLGQGSRFWFEVNLPTSQAWQPEPSQPTRQIVGYEGKRRRVLVVDDRWENRSVIADLLRPLGFAVQEAQNGQEGLDRTIGTPPNLMPDLIITDLVMPGLSGLEMVQQIRSQPQFADVTIIASSATVFESEQQQSRQAGCDDFLPKPVQSEQLLNQIRHHLQLSWLCKPIDAEAQTIVLSDDLSLRPITRLEPKADSIAYSATDLTSCTIPPIEDLKALYKAAQIGDIIAIKEEALRLQQLDTAYHSFTKHLLQLAQQFDEENIFKIVKQYVPQV